MPKTKISEFSATPANNTDIDSINIAEGCAPSGINDAIRELMAQLKDFQTGAVGDSFNGPIGSTTASTGAFTTLTTTGTINNLTVGRGAGAVSTNTAVGASALAANTTGSYNTAFGQEALKLNTTGVENTASGNGALVTNTTGSFNSAHGLYSLRVNSTGSYNSALGHGSLQSNTTASNNTAVGYQAAYTNTTGAQITAIGRYALYSNTTGTDVSALGNGALFSNTTGNYNIAVGTGALNSNTTASNNTAVGYQAGYTNATGVQNTFMGFQSGQLSTGNLNTYLGAYSGFLATSGINNTFLGGGAGYSMTTGSKNTIIGNYSGNQGGLDIRTSGNNIVLSDGDGNPAFYYRSATSAWYMSATYDVTSAASANMVIFSGGLMARSTSALKYKQDIRDLESMDISALRPVRYKSKCVGDDQTKDHLGLIADEAADAGFEELVTRGADGEVEGFQYERLTVVLLKKLQVQDALITQLKARLDAANL